MIIHDAPSRGMLVALYEATQKGTRSFMSRCGHEMPCRAITCGPWFTRLRIVPTSAATRVVGLPTGYPCAQWIADGGLKRQDTPLSLRPQHHTGL